MLKFAKWVGIIVLGLLLLAAFVPFLIPITPFENLRTPQAAALPESQFVTIPYAGTDGIDIHYLASKDLEDGVQEEEGEATFVLLHGSLFNAFTWNEVFDFFDERGHVIAYDQIPYGLSEKLVEGDWSGNNPYSIDAAVEQLLTLLDTFGVEKAILVGNSYGAVLALQSALTHPERVEALILADAAVYIQESVPAWAINLPQVQRLGPLLGRMVGNSESFVRQTYLDPAAIDSERMRLTLVHTEVIRWDEAMWAYLQQWGVAPVDLTGQLSAISQRSLVITGDSDTIVLVTDSEQLANTLPNAEYAILSACGHVPQEECPTPFKEAVSSWLEQFNQ